WDWVVLIYHPDNRASICSSFSAFCNGRSSDLWRIHWPMILWTRRKNSMTKTRAPIRPTESLQSSMNTTAHEKRTLGNSMLLRVKPDCSPSSDLWRGHGGQRLRLRQ